MIWHNLKRETTTTQRHIRQQHDPLFPLVLLQCLALLVIDTGHNNGVIFHLSFWVLFAHVHTRMDALLHSHDCMQVLSSHTDKQVITECISQRNFHIFSPDFFFSFLFYYILYSVHWDCHSQSYNNKYNIGLRLGLIVWNTSEITRWAPKYPLQPKP